MFSKRLFTALSGAVLVTIFTLGQSAQAELITFDPTPSVALGGMLNPGSQTFTQDGMFVESFWALNIGSIGAFFTAHFHIGTDTGSTGNVERQHFNGINELQGFFIERTDGMPFSLSSLDFRVRDTNSINGFSSSDVQVLLSTDFDPMQTVVSQFTPFSVGTGAPSFGTVLVTGFDNVTGVFISSSASVSFDNVITGPAATAGAQPVPEPSSLAMLCVAGFAGVITRMRKRNSAVASVTTRKGA